MGKLWKVLLGGVIVVVLMVMSFVGGIAATRLSGVAAAGPDTNNVPQFKVFWEAWQIVQDHYVDPKAIDPTKMTYGAIQGMLSTLGDTGHTRFLSPDDVQVMNSELSGHFAGIGAEVSQRDGAFVLVPLPKSPALKAGLLAGDILSKVDGQSVDNLSLEQVVTKIRGPKGTQVTLTVYHQGQADPVDITITRDDIQIPAVTWAMIPNTHIAWLQVAQFSSVANDQLVEAIGQARDHGVQGWIVDMRNDPGGLLNEAVQVTSQFIPTGTVVIQQDRSGARNTLEVQPGGKATDLPLVVLINQQTASAAEIFAGAIQDNHRGLLIGESTFGTGTVLSTFKLSDGSEIYLGTSEWLTPDGKTIKGNGIQPDRKIQLAPGGRALLPEEMNSLPTGKTIADIDVQLSTAIQVVAGEIQSK